MSFSRFFGVSGGKESVDLKFLQISWNVRQESKTIVYALRTESRLWCCFIYELKISEVKFTGQGWGSASAEAEHHLWSFEDILARSCNLDFAPLLSCLRLAARTLNPTTGSQTEVLICSIRSSDQFWWMVAGQFRGLFGIRSNTDIGENAILGF
ncbi:uncharacterized protein BT62DRAFT_1011146 [Guyanagaster necrorhizus]|uniref:Uncharacterized protein n=1 Tax=Guyanagaster necrorhizus TaxID=856835 RepID=A0A9P7VL04_9AGAR|nr:uncharacterized protein BT62DRAFT_1011146 [Guyanagaster necrorhizus MCA 3950]KAG7441839.1 hypothetical protein BT62DRAFT_1011146 [Guyanagaster necrorhizus MCA 3950]